MSMEIDFDKELNTNSQHISAVTQELFKLQGERRLLIKMAKLAEAEEKANAVDPEVSP